MLTIIWLVTNPKFGIIYQTMVYFSGIIIATLPIALIYNWTVHRNRKKKKPLVGRIKTIERWDNCLYKAQMVLSNGKKGEYLLFSKYLLREGMDVVLEKREKIFLEWLKLWRFP